MFFIALFSVQYIESFELSSLAQLQKPTTKVQNFEEMCYYELKQELIIKKYVEKIEAEVQKVYIAHKHVQTDAISFELFWKIFKEGRYGKIATESQNRVEYVHLRTNIQKCDLSQEQINHLHKLDLLSS